MPIISIPGKTPKIHPSAFVMENATIIGDVEIGEKSGIWFGSVVRGDVHYIRIGKRTNIQDLCILHVTSGTHPCVIEDDVTIGHNVTLHGCLVKSRVLVGIGAILLDEVVVESDSFISAGALLVPGTHVPPGVLMMGSPAKVKRKLTDAERLAIVESANHYVEYQEMYR